ncbi:hypothetical protein CIB84_001010 [Bambusicola thoracicus]|uniref:Uncharacterized protein n=1 Tax=Bambusicola thoracicus TaxID=9083 RepID=A0A2P4TFW7_BAMTH|nr:hypothetical protein CIB84_001010 [Bambusicola thoracicus]
MPWDECVPAGLAELHGAARGGIDRIDGSCCSVLLSKKVQLPAHPAALGSALEGLSRKRVSAPITSGYRLGHTVCVWLLRNINKYE